MLKSALLSIFLFAGSVSAHPSMIVIRHPQANVNYTCHPDQTLDNCIDIACSYSTSYDCRMIGQTGNVIFIETYISPYYRQPTNTFIIQQQSSVVVPFAPIFVFREPSSRHKVIHRQNDRSHNRHHNQRRR